MEREIMRKNSFIVRYSQNYIEFSHPLKSFEVRILNKLGLAVPEIHIERNKVEFKTLHPGSYFVTWLHNGLNHTEMIHIEEKEVPVFC